MALRQLRFYGDPLLAKKSKPIVEITEKIVTLLDDMLETMRRYDGVGLAAPQVGALRRIVLVEYDGVVYELINPVITETEGVQSKDEACLSIPGKVGTVERPVKIAVEYTDRSGESKRIEAEETLAVVMCHEIDHLDGVLYTDRALPETFRDVEREADSEDGGDADDANDGGEINVGGGMTGGGAAGDSSGPRPDEKI